MDIRRWIRFFAGGVATTVVSYAVYLALVPFLSYQRAYFAAYVLGIAVAYVINSVLVFRVPLSRSRFVIYPLIYLFQYAMAAGLLALGVEVVGLPVKLAPLAVIVVMVPISYVLNRLVLGRSPGNGLPGSSA
jgi:putative flippase GtrA